MVVESQIPINHRMLEWARKEASLTPDLAARKARIREIKGSASVQRMTPSSRLERWEQGPDTPTFAQLESLAKAYRRPVLTFFLTEPPQREVHPLDFRSLGNKEPHIRSSEAELSALVRQNEALQKTLRGILTEAGHENLPFIGSVTPSANPIAVANRIRQTLGYDPATAKGLYSAQRLFSFIRTKAENKGVYVLLQGDLGSHHTSMSPDVFRGFTLSDRLAPIVVVNPNDTKTANVFTLIHELCHLWLGDTGISNWNSLNIEQDRSPIPNEQFCDRVAAEFLAPQSDLLKNWDLLTIGYGVDVVVKRIARQLHVSPIVVARRLLEFGKISPKDYWKWYGAYQEEWLEIKEELSDTIKKPPRPSYRNRTRNRLGDALIKTVMNATRDGRISELEASHLLNVKINNFARVV